MSKGKLVVFVLIMIVALAGDALVIFKTPLIMNGGNLAALTALALAFCLLCIEILTMYFLRLFEPEQSH